MHCCLVNICCFASRWWGDPDVSMPKHAPRHILRCSSRFQMFQVICPLGLWLFETSFTMNFPRLRLCLEDYTCPSSPQSQLLCQQKDILIICSCSALKCVVCMLIHIVGILTIRLILEEQCWWRHTAATGFPHHSTLVHTWEVLSFLASLSLRRNIKGREEVGI